MGMWEIARFLYNIVMLKRKELARNMPQIQFSDQKLRCQTLLYSVQFMKEDACIKKEEERIREVWSSTALIVQAL